MRIKDIRVSNVPPVFCFEAEGLSDLVVIAGPNGVGKTRLITALLNYFHNFNQPAVSLSLEATSDEERVVWGQSRLDTANPADVNKLRQLLTQNQRRRNFKSSILYYESDRSIQNVKALQFQWEFPDPWEELISWDTAFKPLKTRWEDTIHAIFRKIQSQKSSIAARAIKLRAEGHKSMNLEFTDPLDPFRDAFQKLLGPKKLIGVDVQRQTLQYADGDRQDDVKSLSSGEREVLNITFDFLLRKPVDCVVFFDEPELHLHPELLLKLITTLRTSGGNNQFILITHSPAVISSSLDDSVVFLTPPKNESTNQAIMIKAGDETSEALHKLGQSIGVVALGRKIALVEGSEASLDKQTYGHILANRFPSVVLQPVGGKDQLLSFDSVLDNILNRTIWGVEFFMLADRDAVPLNIPQDQLRERSDGRFRVLSRYHLENYFLDERVLSLCFRDQEPATSWLRNESEISRKLTSIAKDYLSYATSLIVSKQIRQETGNVDLMPKGCVGKKCSELIDLFVVARGKERERFDAALQVDLMSQRIEETFQSLQHALDEGRWKAVIPGKPILATFANAANIPLGRLKSLYISSNAQSGSDVFQEIVDIFEGWDNGTYAVASAKPEQT